MPEADDSTLLTQNNTDATKIADDKAVADKAAADKVVEDQAAADKAAADAKAAADVKDDDKAADDKAADDKAAADKAAADAKVVPEEYADFSMPENAKVEPHLVDAFKKVAKELGLTQAQAQKVVDLQAVDVKERMESQVEAFGKVKEGWVDEIKADKDLGGADYEKNVGVAVSAMNKFGTEGLKQVMDESGLGSHPEVVRFFHTIGKAIGEDKFVEGDAKPEGKPFYDKSDHKR